MRCSSMCGSCSWDRVVRALGTGVTSKARVSEVWIFRAPAYPCRMRGDSIQPWLQFKILFHPFSHPNPVLPQCLLHPTSETPTCHPRQMYLTGKPHEVCRNELATLLHPNWERDVRARWAREMSTARPAPYRGILWSVSCIIEQSIAS